MFVGAVIPVRFLISYEGFMAFIGINFLIMFILNILHYKKHKDKLNLKLIYIWIGFLVVNIGYFVFLLGDIGTNLYQNFGIWFNENDALHVLLILWSCFILVLLKKDLIDKVYNSPVQDTSHI
jgi:purine-cytosine permease-like protein